jgi:putative membrane protein
MAATLPASPFPGQENMSRSEPTPRPPTRSARGPWGDRLFAAVALSAALSMACQQNGARTDNPATAENEAIGTAGVSSGDKDFVEHMMMDGMAEVELGKMAKDKASTPEVKQFADRMVRDHSKAGDELKQIASKHSIATSAQIDEKHRDLMNKLSMLRGAEFDHAYMEAMVDGHQDVIDELQKHASEDRFGDNKGAVKPEPSNNPAEADINKWAANALPTVREHLNMAKQIEEKLDKAGNRSY